MKRLVFVSSPHHAQRTEVGTGVGGSESGLSQPEFPDMVSTVRTARDEVADGRGHAAQHVAGVGLRIIGVSIAAFTAQSAFVTIVGICQ